MSDIYFIEEAAKAFAPLVAHAVEKGQDVQKFCEQYMYMYTDGEHVSWFKHIMTRAYLKLPIGK